MGSTANSNSLMDVTLIDPSGNQVKSLEIASNSEGIFSEERLKIPTNAEIGLWKITVSSGSNLDKVEFNVLSEVLEGMTIRVSEEILAGDLLKMSISAAKKTSIIIEISDIDGNKIQELSCNTTREFKCETFWSSPKNTIPGTYTIKAYDAVSSIETTFKIIPK